MTKASKHVISSDLDSDNLANNAVGTAELQNGSVVSVKIATGAVDTDKLANNSVATSKLQNSSVTNQKLFDQAVDHNKLANDAVITNKIADNAITGAKIQDGAISTSNIADDAVTSAKISNGAVGSSELADNSIINTHIANGVIDIPKLKGSDKSIGSIPFVNSSKVWSTIEPGEEGAVLSIQSGVPVWNFGGNVPIGTIIDYTGATEPFGWVFCNGQTVGNGNSNASYSGIQYEGLFVHLWNNFANSILAVSGGRGGSALEDWNADKTISLPDLRGRVLVGNDTMGASSANRMKDVASPDNNTIGATGGSKQITLNSNQIPEHYHYLFITNTSGAGPTFEPAPEDGIYQANASATNNRQYEMNTGARRADEPTIGRSSKVGSSTGSSNAKIDVTQPFMVVHKLIKYLG